ncbi:MAG: phosphatase PAP2 family protein [Miltoncostaeaceae bacterium]
MTSETTSHGDRRRASRQRLIALAAACALATAVIYGLAVLTTRGQEIDGSAFGNLSPRINPEAFEATDNLLSTISFASVALLGLLIAALALVRRRGDLAFAAVLLLIGANVTTQALKTALPRPDLLDEASSSGSFPSGHVTVAMSLAMAFVLISPRGVRPLVATVGTLYAAGIGVAVLALDWHRPSDVIGAFLVSTAWAAVAAAMVGPGRLDRARSPHAGRAAAWAAGVLVVAFVVVAGLTAMDRFDVLSVVDDRTAFALATVVVGAGAVATMGLFVAALRDDDGPAPV